MLRCVPVIVVTHSRKSVLISVRSLVPAKAGAGRGVNLEKDSGMSCLEKEVEGPFSDWEGKTVMRYRDNLSSKHLYLYILPPYRKELDLHAWFIVSPLQHLLVPVTLTV